MRIRITVIRYSCDVDLRSDGCRKEFPKDKANQGWGTASFCVL